MTTNNAPAPTVTKYAVMATIYVEGVAGRAKWSRRREKDLTGPWKATPEDAVKAFGKKFAKHSHMASEAKTLFRVFLAETAAEAKAVCRTSTGHWYNGSSAMPSRVLFEALNDEGFYLNPGMVATARTSA